MPTRLFVAGQLDSQAGWENSCGRARAEEGPGQQPGGSPPRRPAQSRRARRSPRPSNGRSSFTRDGWKAGGLLPEQWKSKFPPPCRAARQAGGPDHDGGTSWAASCRSGRRSPVPRARLVTGSTAVSIEVDRVKTDSPQNAGGRRQKLPLTLRAGLRRQHAQ